MLKNTHIHGIIKCSILSNLGVEYETGDTRKIVATRVENFGRD